MRGKGKAVVVMIKMYYDMRKKKRLLGIKIVSKATLALPAGRDLRLERPCRVKRFLALVAEWSD